MVDVVNPYYLITYNFLEVKLEAMPKTKSANQHKRCFADFSYLLEFYHHPNPHILNKLYLYSIISMYVLFVIFSQFPTSVPNYPSAYAVFRIVPIYALYLDASALQDARNDAPVAQCFIAAKASQTDSFPLPLQFNKFRELPLRFCACHLF